MEMRTKERRKFSTTNKKHFGEKQDTFLRFGTLSHHRNRRIRLHYRNDTFTRERTHNIQIKNHKSDKTKL